MAVFKILDKLQFIKEIPFKLEKEIQKIVEGNMNLLLDLSFVKSEFALNQFRIDTLAYDKESKAFVIIEYKKDKTFSVVDQGYAYLSLMLNNKADFILEYNENSSESLKRKDVDWSQSRVLFISSKFTKYQKEAINFKDLPIELWEIKRFENESLIFNQIEKANPTESINTLSNSDSKEKIITQELKVYTEKEHIEKAEFAIRELYEILKERLFNFGDNITLNPRKYFVGFKVDGNTFCDVVFLGKSLKIYLNLKSDELEDLRKISRDVSNVGHWGNGAYEIKLSTDENIDYIMSLIKQSYDKNKK